jgi:CheY-like chemotaxis protein
MMLDLILCVDDDPITLMLCKKYSKTTFSNEIVTAQNGEEALQYLNSNRKTTIPILKTTSIFFRFKHACNGVGNF